MIANFASRPGPLRVTARERGIVVFVALIAMVLLSLAAVALMRSVHTNTLVVGNIAFRQSAQAMAASAVEKAVFDLFLPTKVIADLTNHNTARNYYASVQPNQDAAGVPLALQGDLTAYPGGAQVITDNVAGNVARYIIERMCDDDALGVEALGNFRDCELVPPKQSTGMEVNRKQGFAIPPIPFYRVTVRVDGPGNSVAFSQAMLLGMPP